MSHFVTNAIHNDPNLAQLVQQGHFGQVSEAKLVTDVLPRVKRDISGNFTSFGLNKIGKCAVRLNEKEYSQERTLGEDKSVVHIVKQSHLGTNDIYKVEVETSNPVNGHIFSFLKIPVKDQKVGFR